MTFFNALYTYKQREKSDGGLFNPREDYLTECMAECLRALNGEQLAGFLNDLSGERIPPNDRNAIIACVGQNGLSIETQKVAGDDGRPDLLISFHGVPTYLFENKIDHHVSQREPNETGEILHQLHRYAEWLKKNHTEERSKIAPSGKIQVREKAPAGSKNLEPPPANPHLFFVTQWTPAPEDFDEQAETEDCPYGRVQRSKTNWWDFCKTLQCVTDKNSENAVARYLTKNFKGCLEGFNMANEYPTQNSFSALDLYMNEDRKLVYLLTGMMDTVKDPANFDGKNWPRFDNATGEMGLRSFLKSTGQIDKEFFVGVGFLVPQLDSVKYEERLLSEKGDFKSGGIKVYLSFGHLKAQNFKNITGVPPEWRGQSDDFVIRRQSDLVICKDLHEFADDPDKRAEAIFGWLKTKASELGVFLDQKLADQKSLEK